MFVAVGPELTFFFNDAYRPMLGNRQSRAIGQPFERLWEDVWSEIRPDVAAALAGEPVFRSQLPLTMTRHGYEELTWWTYSYSPFLETNGEIVGMWCITTDVTEGVRSAQELAQLNATLEREISERTRERDQLWNISPDLYVIVDRDGYYRSVNPSWHSELGYETHELVGHRFDALVHPDDVAGNRAAFAELMAGHTINDRQFRMRSKQGEYCWYAWTCVPEDNVIYAAGRNVQQRLEMEEQLRQSQKLEAIGRLTGGIAHDFNNILAGIGGALELVRARLAQGRTEGIERFMDAATSSVGRAAALTHRLLAYSRQQPLSLTPVHAGDILRGLDVLLQRTLGETIVVRSDIDDTLWLTLSDISQLENAILNLAINARDAMPGGGTLTVMARNSRAVLADGVEEDVVEVSVSDTGSGMSASTIARAFDPFFTTKPVGEGTGLGLSMVDGFARQTGGRVDIRSVLGEGTTVSLFLPRHAGHVPAPAETPREGPRTGGGQHVMIVEDDETVRELNEDVLRELGYTVTSHADAYGALEAVERGVPIDLLVTDVGLPGLNGRQLAERARLARPRLPVLFVTGYTWDAFEPSHVLEAHTHMLTKPFDMATFAARVAAMLDAATTP
nr:PAS domain-containing sensor histidine kinase [Luteibacter sp. Sphag1AF]